jgi:hypothetical protein
MPLSASLTTFYTLLDGRDGEIRNKGMITTPDKTLLDPSSVTRRIIERQFIRQMRFLTAADLRQLAAERGLGFSASGDDVQRLWQIGLLRADMLISKDPLDIEGLVVIRRNDAGEYLYADARDPIDRSEGLGGVVKDLGALPADVYFMFHRFRYYVLRRIEELLEPRVVTMQMLLSTDGYRRVLDYLIEHFNKSSSGERFRARVRRWNEVTSLAVDAEPFTFGKLFGHYGLPYNYIENEEEFDLAVASHFHEHREVMQNIGLDEVKRIISELCREAETLDPNKDVHRILRLTGKEYRLERVKGKLGGAMHLLAMAEMIRRSAEAVFETELPEEDEFGFGFDSGSFKEHFYGAQRLIDDYEARGAFVRDLRLDHGVRLRWYVEGETEMGAVEYAVGRHEEIEVINLKGDVIASRGKGLSFRDNLLNDIRRSVFSWVSLDGDAKDNLRVLRKAAEKDEMFGMFFVSDPDFEFANFTLGELVEVLWGVAEENGAPPEEKQKLLEQTSVARSGKQLFESARRAVPALAKFNKGKVWGERLMRLALENPDLRQDGGSTRERPIIEAVAEALRAVQCEYYRSKQTCKVDAGTGRIVDCERERS